MDSTHLEKNAHMVINHMMDVLRVCLVILDGLAVKQPCTYCDLHQYFC